MPRPPAGIWIRPSLCVKQISPRKMCLALGEPHHFLGSQLAKLSVVNW